MNFREALKLANGVETDREAPLYVVSSLELLHFRTFLQAQLAEKCGRRVPQVCDFGFDQLETGLRFTQDEGVFAPVVLILDWADFHPALTWRSRGLMASLDAADWANSSALVFARIEEWLGQRKPWSTVVVLPSLRWLPPLDSVHPGVLGQTRSLLIALCAELSAAAHDAKAFCVNLDADVDLRSLLSGGSPLSPEAAAAAAETCAAVLFRDQRRKAIVVDLDNTLWAGVLGEVGSNGVECADHGAGYPFHVFQRFLQKAKREGILLAYCTKNHVADVEDVFSRPSTVLNFDDFASGRCTWTAKSSALAEIAGDLDIGMEAVVFIDDNPAEIAEVSSQFPEVLTIRTPESSSEWPGFIRLLQSVIWTVGVSDEDRLRVGNEDRLRKAARSSEASDSGQYQHLADLELRMRFDWDAAAVPRTVELLNKTNQFNLTGERVRALEFEAACTVAGAFCYSVELSDRFGSFGTVGVVYGQSDNAGHTCVENLVLSCRSLGRGVEAHILAAVVSRQQSKSLDVLLCSTPRNEPARRFICAVSDQALEVSSVPDNVVTVQINCEALSALASRILDETKVIIDVD